MAILNKIRQRSVFLLVVIAMALFAFVLTDLFRSKDSFFSEDQNVVATIDGEDIDRSAFLRKIELAQRSMGPQATNSQVSNRVWNEEVRSVIMKSQFDKLGMSVETEEMKAILKKTLEKQPEFLNESGTFDEFKLNEYISNLKETSPLAFENWVNYEKELSLNSLSDHYYNLVKAGVNTTLSEGKLTYNLESDNRNIDYVQVALSSISDSLIKISDPEISEYLNDNSKNYQVEASRDMQYIIVKEEASAKDIQNIKSELNLYITGRFKDENGRSDTIPAFSTTNDNKTYVNLTASSDIKFNPEFISKKELPNQVSDSIFKLKENDVYGPYKDGNYFKISKVTEIKRVPDSSEVRHILIPFVGATRAAKDVVKTDLQAKATADSILQVLRSGRAKFTDLLPLSSDKVSNEKEGVIKFAYRSRFAPEFKAFSFDNKPGSLDVVKTSFGYHIIEVLSQTAEKKFVQLGTIAREIEPSEETRSDIFRAASNFEVNAVENNFEALAKELKYNIKVAENIEALDENISGGKNEQRAIVRWAFNNNTEINDIKRFSIPEGYIIVQLLGKTEAGLMSIKQARKSIAPILRDRKKIEQIKSRIKSGSLKEIAIAEKTSVKSATLLNMKNTLIPGAGPEPNVVGAVFGLKEGQVSEPIGGNKGVYVVKVVKSTPAIELEDYKSFAKRIQARASNRAQGVLYNALKDNAEIEDHRADLEIQ